MRLLGYVSDDERQRLYREASMLVMPSLDEGFGMPALEAMTIGVPVVAAERGALPEVVGDAGLLVDPDDPAALAAAMQRLLGRSGCCGASCAASGRRARAATSTGRRSGPRCSRPIARPSARRSRRE